MVGVNNKYISCCRNFTGGFPASIDAHGSYASELRLSEDRSTVQCLVLKNTSDRDGFCIGSHFVAELTI